LPRAINSKGETDYTKDLTTVGTGECSIYLNHNYLVQDPLDSAIDYLATYTPYCNIKHIDYEKDANGHPYQSTAL
jgi:hypothetical protein